MPHCGLWVHHLEETDGSLTREGVAYHHPQPGICPACLARSQEQQMMLHLDFEVTDLDSEVVQGRAVNLGAEL